MPLGNVVAYLNGVAALIHQHDLSPLLFDRRHLQVVGQAIGQSKARLQVPGVGEISAVEVNHTLVLGVCSQRQQMEVGSGARVQGLRLLDQTKHFCSQILIVIGLRGRHARR